ncbi:respiratory nitrate reductase subunit gamma [Pyxidicoccus xibeiensis]|uniref:respiratory nitrate reductase subunit gamma n=1 Tax=Pyxidicoccus xibeiensis TaxID=2906759 RepID=UPI0020A7066B|nr:respiratory nitrate reductase subunit gamma [Pyxidicoccus xibeiensis]MCP3140156.1 respiratory nitrate reductase subunit gamma [Pyxidicoccus xibeiensis]
MSDSFLFSFLPYAAAGVAVAGLVRRQLSRAPARAPAPDEPWTPAGRAVLAGGATVALTHLLGLAAPRAMQVFNASPARLFTLEAVSLIGGMLLGWGLLSLTLRRVQERQWAQAGFLGLLLAQVLTGLHIAVALRWASAWYLHVSVPYLRSLLAFQPDATRLAAAPGIFQVHLLAGFVLLAVAPFVRARRAVGLALVPRAPESPLLATPREETP